MADQDKPQGQIVPQPVPPVVVDTTPEAEKPIPTVTESAPAPEPVAELEPVPVPVPVPVPESEPVAAETAPEPPKATETTEPTPTEPASTEPVAEPTTAEPAPEPTKATETAAEPTAEPAAEPVAVATEAPTEAPKAAEPEPTEPQNTKPEYLTKTPVLEQFFDRLPNILSATGHNEMWGVPLKGSDDIPTVNVLIKFLRANGGDLKLAEDQLTKALEWRKQMDPLTLVDSTSYDPAKFGGLGYLTTYPREGKRDLIVTWNIYGAVKNVDETFGDVNEFVKWRAALMELAVKELKLDQATSVIDYNGEDPYQMIQVHDYVNVSFLRLNPSIRAATKKTIEVFSTAYPELLREKFFVNVPVIMGWMFAAMKLFVSENTIRKFHPISNGANLAREFPALAEKFPKAYGGSGPDLEDSGRTVRFNKESETSS